MLYYAPSSNYVDFKLYKCCYYYLLLHVFHNGLCMRLYYINWVYISNLPVYFHTPQLVFPNSSPLLGLSASCVTNNPLKREYGPELTL